MSHLALFLPSLAMGGAERSSLLLAQLLAEQGCRVDLLLADPRGAARLPRGLRVVGLGGGRVLAALPGLLGYLRAERPRALLSPLDHTSLVALGAVRWSRVSTRVVVGVHSMIRRLYQGSRWLSRARWIPWLARLAYPRAHALVAVSEAVAADLRRHLGPTSVPIQVIGNPLPVEAIREAARQPVDHPWFQDPSLRVVVCLARLSPEKDLETLIRAFRRLRPECRLLILGEGPQRECLQHQVEQLGLAGRVELAGALDNPYALLARASAFALSSRVEGLPGALLEALACSVPVVATDSPGGCAEILGHGRYGRLVPVGDDEALASALAEVIAGQTFPAPDLSRYRPEAVAEAYRRVLFP